MQLTDDIKYKLHFILDKKRSNKKLTSEEENYLKRYNEFLKILESYQVEQELNNFSFNSQEILTYLNNKEKEIRRTIPKTKSRRKLK